MSALLAADYRDRTVHALDGLRATYERRRQTAERFALHAAQVNDKHTADFFSREAKLWAEASEEVTLRIQMEQGR